MNTTVAILVFTAVSSLGSVLLAMIAGTLTVPVVWGALAVGLLGAIYGFYQNRNMRTEEIKLSRLDIAIMVFFMLVCIRQFCWLYYERGGDIVTLNRHGFADLHVHRAFIARFLNQTPFWPESPLIVGESLNYHFGMDLFTALWAKIGVPLPRVFAMVGIAFSVLTLFSLFRWGGSFTVAGFLFSGGIAGYMFFQDGILKDYSMEDPVAWKNLMLTLFVPQRGYLYAFPAGLTLLWSWRRRFIDKKSALPFFSEVILLGAMPFFHLHTFIFLFFVYFFWMVWTRRFRESLPYGAAVLILAVPMIFKLTGGFQRASVIWFSKGWMLQNVNPVGFFFINFGFFAPLFLWSTLVAFREKNKNAVMVLIPAWTVFAISMFVMFSPWDWDNIKLISWVYLMMLPVAGQLVIRRLPLLPKAGLVILLFWSGLMSVLTWSGKQSDAFIMKRARMDEVCHVLKNVPVKSRIATAQEAYHEVLFCGHKIVAGYSGTLRSHGLRDVLQIEDRLNRLMKGDPDWRHLADQIKADYLFWGANEQRRYPDSNRPWEAESFKLASGEWGTIYDLKRSSALSAVAVPFDRNSGEGISAKYFPNTNGAGDFLRQEIIQSIHFEWQKENAPIPAPISISMEGSIYVPETGRTTFCLGSDDGSDLKVGDILKLDNSGQHSLRVRCGAGDFKTGWYPIRLFYCDFGGGGYLKLWWQLPSGKEEIIPSQYLRSEGNGQA